MQPIPSEQSSQSEPLPQVTEGTSQEEVATVMTSTASARADEVPPHRSITERTVDQLWEHMSCTERKDLVTLLKITKRVGLSHMRGDHPLLVSTRKAQRKHDKKQKILEDMETKIETARAHYKNHLFDQCINEASDVLEILKKYPDPELFQDAYRLITESLWYSGAPTKAVQYFVASVKYDKKICPLDIFIYGPSFISIDTEGLSHPGPNSRTAACFNPAMAKKFFFDHTPPSIAKSDNWKWLVSQNKDYLPFILALSEMRSKTDWDIRKHIDRYKTIKDMEYMSLLLTCIETQNLIEKKRYREAEEAASLIEEEDYSYLKNYFLAVCARHLKNQQKAYDLLLDGINKGNQFYQEFADLCLEMDKTDLAIDSFLDAQDFYETHEFTHEAAYFSMRADLLEQEQRYKIRLTQQKKETEEAATTGQQVLSEPAKTRQEEPSSTPPEPPDQPSVKPETRKKKRIISEGKYYYRINKLIKTFKNNPDSDINEDKIRRLLQESLSHHPDSLWLLHTAGWWFYEQGEIEESRRCLLSGFSKAAGGTFKYKLPQNHHDEHTLVKRITHYLEQVSTDLLATPEGQAQAKDMAAFLSAYAYLLVEQGYWPLASELRQWADRLDERRRRKARLRHYQANLSQQKLIVISAEKAAMLLAAMKSE